MVEMPKVKQSNIYRAVGLMSGTSGDGLDIASCLFKQNVNQGWTYELNQTKYVPFKKPWNSILHAYEDWSPADLMAYHISFGTWLGIQVNNFIHEYDLNPDIVASHGHTVIHQPEKQVTFQLGNGQAIFNEVGIPVITDFRQKDVLMGGQGAPLVPVADKFLFPKNSVCLNLGGIANATFKTKNQLKAFDICPFNLLLNHYAGKLGLPFDKDGAIAKSGEFNELVNQRLNEHPFYQLDGPKSLDKAFVYQTFIPLIEREPLPEADILHTLCVHFVDKILFTVQQLCMPSAKVFITGGGIHNSFIKELLFNRSRGKMSIDVPDQKLIDFKEALCFAFLGVLRIREETNTLASVTGANADSCSGVIYQ
jgi:anhydro-N-acetylmuramic acid kinase